MAAAAPSLIVGLDELSDEIFLYVAGFLPPADLLRFQCLCRRTAALPTDSTCWRELCIQRWRDKPRYALTPVREQWLEIHQPLNWQRRYFFFESDARRTIISDFELQSLTWFMNFTPQSGGQGIKSVRRVRFRDGMLTHVAGFPPLSYTLDPPAPPPFRPDGSHPLQAQPRAIVGPPTMMESLLTVLSRTFLTRMNEPEPPEETARYSWVQNEPATAAAGTSAAAPPPAAAPFRTPAQSLLIANFPPHAVDRRPENWEWVIGNENVTFVSAAEGVLPRYYERGFMRTGEYWPEPQVQAQA